MKSDYADPANYPAPLPKSDQDELIKQVDAFAPEMSELAHKIWETPELGYQEVKTSALLRDVLTKAGFEVSSGVADIPTAFVARFKTGEGPVIGIVAEMDALPGFSQAAEPVRTPIDGQSVGHACGHHMFGTGSVGAAIVLARWMQKNNVHGEVRVFGTPAEEGGSGKVYMARAGVFDGLDIAFHWHPDSRNMVWQSRSLASIGVKFTFHGTTAHAAAAPEKGRSALHGLEAFHHMIALMRETVPEGTHIHYVVTQGGLAPNVIPDLTQSHVNVRHADIEIARSVLARIELAAKGAAMGTGTKVTAERIGAVHSILPNDTLGRVMYANMLAAPALEWNESEYAFASKVQESMDNPPDFSQLDKTGPYEFGRLGAFSSDMGDVSWLAPTAALGTVTWVPGTRPHTWQAVAAGGTSIGDKGTALAALVLASTAAHLLREPAYIKAAQDEFKAARGEGFTYKPLIGDGAPPFDYQRRHN